MPLNITRAELWNVIYRAYEAGHFGPTAKPTDSLEKILLADRENLLHLAAGGPNGTTSLSDADRARLTAALEDLFNGELYFEVNGFLSFQMLEGLRWRPREAGPF
jgi:hypothetical protein